MDQVQQKELKKQVKTEQAEEEDVHERVQFLLERIRRLEEWVNDQKTTYFENENGKWKVRIKKVAFELQGEAELKELYREVRERGL